MQIPNLAAARDVASSPSGCANLCEAAGLKPKGRLTWLAVRSCKNWLGYENETNLGVKNLCACVDIVDVD